MPAAHVFSTSLRPAHEALRRARRELATLEAVAVQLARPLELSRAHALWQQLEVAGTARGTGPGLFERLRAARAQLASAEAGLRAAEADLFAARAS